MFRLIYVFLLSIFAVSSFSQTKPLPPKVVAEINKRIEANVNPGIVIGIIDQDGTHFYSFGKKKIRGKKVNEHSIFEIGSISKVFTATILADMVVKDELSTDDPIQKFLPSNVRVPTYEGVHITLGQLSDHTSSLPRLPDNLNPAVPQNPYADYTTDQLYAFISKYELKRPIGSEYEYSNLAVGLLGHILALKANKSYEELLRTTITDPLGMNETGITLTKRMKKNLAFGHQQGIQVMNWDLPALAGAGGIRSSAYDMVRFLGANLQLFEHPLTRAMLLAHMPRHDKAGNYRIGLGWHIIDSPFGDIIVHSGTTGGYYSFAGFIKETGKGVVVLTNSIESVDDIGLHLLDPNVPLRNVLPHVATRLKEIIDDDGPSDLITQFDKIKKESWAKFDFSEMGINALGYYYLNRKQFDAAIAVFLLNISEYPKSANVYDSYAEALMEKGEKDQAIIYYKKSLEINPGNENAVMMLSNMGVTVEIPVSEIDTVTLETYVGTYQLAPGFNIVITREGTGLIAQATGQGAFPIFPKTESEFYYKVVDARVVFNKDADGRVESLTLLQNGREIVAKKID